MTLDPVHFEGITRLVRRIDHVVDEEDHRSFAETVWSDFLDPLVDGGRVVLEPLGEQRRRLVDVEDVALSEPAFQTIHGLDAGTINPTAFTNGLVLDVAQAAMSATPSDLDLHRSRTVVATAHSNDTGFHVHEAWDQFDGGFSRARVLKAPRVNRFEEGVVHALALYLAESEHALEHAASVTDLLVLDGPLYPRGLLKWANRDPELADLLVEEPRPKGVVENYVRLVEDFVERDVPLVGFVKNPASKLITHTVKRKGADAPWVDDTAFFSRLLERGEYVDDVDGRHWEHDTSALTYTSWFRSRGGADRPLSSDGDALDVERHLDPADYEVTFCAIYDPRDDLCYRLEAPLAFTRDEDRRERLTRQVLRDVATARGPPLAVQKADELARISAHEKRSLREALETVLESRHARAYDDHRWGLEEW